MLVNGIPWPRHEVDGTQYRIRLLNGSNARRYEFALEPPPPGGSSFVQIASDGGLLAGPVPRDSVTLASAERAEVIVDFGAYPVGTVVTLVNRLGVGSTGTVMQFAIVRAAATTTAIPDVLSVIEPLDPLAGAGDQDIRVSTAARVDGPAAGRAARSRSVQAGGDQEVVPSR